MRSANAGIKSLAKQFVAWSKHDILPSIESRLLNRHIVCDDGVSYPFFENVMKANIAKYHNNCKNNFSDYKFKKKLESTQKKKTKLSTDHSPNFPHLCDHRLIHRYQNVSFVTKPFVTRFEQDLLQKAPSYEIIKDQETGVFRK